MIIDEIKIEKSLAKVSRSERSEKENEFTSLVLYIWTKPENDERSLVKRD
jgi:hypothetical protein